MQFHHISQRVLLSGLIGACALSAVAAAQVDAPRAKPSPASPWSQHTRPADQTEALAPHHPRQLIVKYRDSLTACAHCIYRAKGAFQASTTDRSPSLDQLMQRFRVRHVRPLFRSDDREQSLRTPAAAASLSLAELRQGWQARVAAAKTRNPRRAAAMSTAVPVPDLSHVYVIAVDDGVEISEAVDAFARDPHVAYAHPDYLASVAVIPDDTYYARGGTWGQAYDDLWGLKRIGVEQAWDAQPDLGAGVTVAVVDTGADATHPDLAANLVPGWDFTTCQTFTREGCAQPKPRDSDPSDGHGHGTHVAGTIAAVGFNGQGVIGVAPRAKIMPLKALNDQGSGLFSDLADAIEYAAESGADVISNSWGCQDACPETGATADAVRFALAMNRVVVFAAGNSNSDVTRFSPQNVTNPKPIIVASTDHLDARSNYSNYGALVDLAAPGGESGPSCTDSLVASILSLRAAGTDPQASACGAEWAGRLVVGTRYYRMRGTSMAAPHVAGAAALILAKHPAFSPEQVRQALRASATDVGSPGMDWATGTGRLNAADALRVESVLRASLASSLSGSTINVIQTPSVTIRGTAAGPDFRDYQVLVGAGRVPTSWTPLGPPATREVQDSVLATWAVSQLPDGLYWIRLVARTRAGFQFEDLAWVEAGRARRVTAASAQRDHAVISGQRIAWQDNANYGIYVHDLGTGWQGRITTDAARATWPELSAHTLVWGDSRTWDGWYTTGTVTLDPCVGIPSAIYRMDLAERIESTLSSVTPNTGTASADGRYTAWSSGGSLQPILCGGKYQDIWYADTVTGSIRQIPRATGVTGDRALPRVSGNRIVWMDLRNGQWDIYLYDASTRVERRLTTHAAHQTWPDISGDRVVWTDFRADASGDLYLYDLRAGTERALVTAPGTQGSASIDGDRIVWMDDRNGNWDVYLYDLTTGREQPLSHHFEGQVGPDLSGNQVVWLDRRHGTDAALDIYTLYVPLLGDLTADGRLTIGDAQRALQMATGSLPAHPFTADVNLDGAVTASDALCILKAASNLLTLPCASGAARSLHVTQAGTGAGKLVAPPSPTPAESLWTLTECQFACGRVHFPAAETVRFAVPQPAYGSTFTGWSGACAGTSSCSVSVASQKSLTANFSAIPNVVTNGGFEQGTTQPTDWSGWSTTKRWHTATAAEPVFEGTKAAKVLLTSGTLRLSHALVPVTAGRTYHARAVLKTSATGTAKVELLWKSAGGGTLRIDTFGDTIGTTNWAIKPGSASPFIVTAPANAATLQVRLVTTPGTGVAYFDGVRVEAK